MNDLRMNDYVTPNHWDTSQFVPFGKLTADQEFNLIAPVFIYYCADVCYRDKAQEALSELSRLNHPLCAGLAPEQILASNAMLAGLDNRYNALMMVIAEDEMPGIASRITEYGSFTFTLPGTRKDALYGDSEGSFALYLTADLVRKALREAQTDTEEDPGPARARMTTGA